MAKAMSYDEGMHVPAWPGWLLMAGISAICLLLGNIAGKLAGFPYYGGFQGALVQQPWPIAAYSVLGIMLASILTLRITIAWTRPMDSRVGAALSLVTIAGLSMRAGGMRSIMQAADGRQVFWLLAAELAILLLVVWMVYSLRFVVGGAAHPKEEVGADWNAAGLQASIFAVAMWVLGQSPAKAQGICCVLASGVIAGFLTHLVIGRNWRGSWCIPLVVGILGYMANALIAGGVDIAKLSGAASTFSAATPLDYAAAGPIGMVLGELLHGEEQPAQTREGLASA